MSKKNMRYMATIQILLDDPLISSPAAAQDYISETLRGLEAVKDWAYLQVGGQQLLPQEKHPTEPYEEGDAWR